MSKSKAHITALRFISLSAAALIALSGCIEAGMTLKNAAICRGGDDTNSANSAALHSQSALNRKQTLSNLDESVCSVRENYLCDRQIFSPDVLDGSSDDRECVDSDLLGLTCVDIKKHTHGTKHLIDRAPASSFVPGGEYNLSEYACYNRQSQIDDQSYAIVGDPATDLKAALESAAQTCVKAIRASHHAEAK